MTQTFADATALIAQALSGDTTPLAHDEDASALARAVEDHGVSALLWQALGGPHSGARRLHHSLEPMVRAAATRDLIVQRELRNTLDALAAAGVQTVVIKGTALAYTVYPQPWLRPRLDTDLLVTHESVGAAARALEACGYGKRDAISTGEFVSHQMVFERTDTHGLRHILDLHWKIANPQLVAECLPFDVLWRDAGHAPALGAHARVPSFAASIVLACVHRLTHHQGNDRLIWLYDLKLLTEQLGPGDWDALRILAVDGGVAGLCLDGLRRARARLNAPLPDEVEAALAGAAPVEASRSYLTRRIRRRHVLISDLKMLDTWRARMRLLREHVFPAQAFMRERYGAATRWPLPALYLHRIVTGAFRWVRH